MTANPNQPMSAGYVPMMEPPAGPGGTYTPEQWNRHIQNIVQAMQASSGWAQKQLDAQMKDALAGRENAVKLAQLSAETSRYGIDEGRKTAMAQLAQADRQFAANHALEEQKFDLDYGKAYSDYVLTPDRYAAGADFVQMAGRAGQGRGPAPYGQGVEFHAKTPEDWAVLAGPAPGGGTPGGGNADPYRQAGSGQDPRVKAINTMLQAVPPSSTPGMDQNDWAVLQAAKNLMSTNLQPGTIERMRPDERKIYSSYVRRSGRSWDDYLSDYQRQGIHQGSARAAV